MDIWNSLVLKRSLPGVVDDNFPCVFWKSQFGFLQFCLLWPQRTYVILAKGLFKRGSSDRTCRGCDCSFRGCALYFSPVIFTWSKGEDQPQHHAFQCVSSEQVQRRVQRKPRGKGRFSPVKAASACRVGTLRVHLLQFLGALQSYHLAGTRGDILSVASLSVAGWALETTEGSPSLLPIASWEAVLSSSWGGWSISFFLGWWWWWWLELERGFHCSLS